MDGANVIGLWPITAILLDTHTPNPQQVNLYIWGKVHVLAIFETSTYFESCITYITNKKLNIDKLKYCKNECCHY